jgi:hypothetical protein
MTYARAVLLGTSIVALAAAFTADGGRTGPAIENDVALLQAITAPLRSA